MSECKTISSVWNNTRSCYPWKTVIMLRASEIQCHSYSTYLSINESMLLYPYGVNENERCVNPFLSCPYCGYSLDTDEPTAFIELSQLIRINARGWNDWFVAPLTERLSSLFTECYKSGVLTCYQYVNCGCVSDLNDEYWYWRHIETRYFVNSQAAQPLRQYLFGLEDKIKETNEKKRDEKEQRKRFRKAHLMNGECSIFQTINAASQLGKLLTTSQTERTEP